MGNIHIIKGDITKIHVDAIVNAANAGLIGGGGVDGAIHRAGGPKIMEECREIGGCLTGEAVITNAGNLTSTYVVHAVGPIWNGGKSHEPELLSNTYSNSLNLAMENGVSSIAFPNISTGVYGFPKGLAAEIAIPTVQKWIKIHESNMEVTFVCFDEENYQLYMGILD